VRRATPSGYRAAHDEPDVGSVAKRWAPFQPLCPLSPFKSVISITDLAQRRRFVRSAFATGNVAKLTALGAGRLTFHRFDRLFSSHATALATLPNSAPTSPFHVFRFEFPIPLREAGEWAASAQTHERFSTLSTFLSRISNVLPLPLWQRCHLALAVDVRRHLWRALLPGTTASYHAIIINETKYYYFV
jgi:hypothetical protein